MTKEQHNSVKKIYSEALNLPEGERMNYVEQAADGDETVVKEVHSLLKFSDQETIIKQAVTPELAGELIQKAIGPRKSLGTRTNIAGPWHRNLFNSANKNLFVYVSIIAVVVFIVGWWTHYHVKKSLIEIKSEELTTILDADALALRIWIHGNKADVQSWAGDPRLEELAEAIISNSYEHTDPEDLKNFPAHKQLQTMMAEYMLNNGFNKAYTLVNKNGVLVSSSVDEVIGIKSNKSAAGLLFDVFSGKTTYTKPLPLFSQTDDLENKANHAATWVDAPVRNKNGEIIGAFGLGQLAKETFSQILQVARLGQSCETYAFDDRGKLLSESRFEDQLRSIGLLSSDTSISSVFNITVKDPGMNLLRANGKLPDLSTQPFTKIVANAIAFHEKADSAITTGVVMEPYRDYRGVRVIGAWMWIPEYDFGIVTEINEAEAFKPLLYVKLIITAIYLIIFLSVVFAVNSSLAVVRLHKQVGETALLGQYTLKQKIGEGGMGEVYLASHAMLKRPTAIKILKKELMTRETVARFEKEVQMASQLNHPNTIEIYDYGQTPDQVFYYAMEYLDGMDIDRLVDSFGPQPIGRVMYILRQVCASLNEAHQKGVIHRDIKPLNIFLCKRGGLYDVVKVLDFGLVKDMYDEHDDLTKPAIIAGTPMYMAPERFEIKSRVSHLADIYSLGAVGQFLLTGRPIFSALSGANMLNEILKEVPKRPSEVVMENIPKELDDLIAQCLKKNPAERPQSVGQILEVLDKLLLDFPWTERNAMMWWEKYNRIQLTLDNKA